MSKSATLSTALVAMVLLGTLAVPAHSGPPGDPGSTNVNNDPDHSTVVIVSPEIESGPARTQSRQTAQGMQLHLDPQTGERTYSAAAETTRTDEDTLKRALNRSDEGLKERVLEDGTRLVDLQGRFQNLFAARTDARGSVVLGCFTQPSRLQAFSDGKRETDHED